LVSLFIVFGDFQSPILYFPSRNVSTIKDEVKSYVNCIEQSVPGKGLVASNFLGLVPREKVWTDRIPAMPDSHGSERDKIKFALVSTVLVNYFDRLTHSQG